MGKKIVIWLVIIILIVLGVWIFSKKGSNLGLKSEASPSPAQSASPKPFRASPKATAPANTITYGQALAQYADRKVQFNDQCQGTPGQIVVKKGQKVLLDNRSKYNQTLSFAGQTLALPAYNWTIITASTDKSLPYGLGIDCKSDASGTKNGAIINIQASILQGL